jgi:hypothetical protein
MCYESIYFWVNLFFITKKHKFTNNIQWPLKSTSVFIYSGFKTPNRKIIVPIKTNEKAKNAFAKRCNVILVSNVFSEQ